MKKNFLITAIILSSNLIYAQQNSISLGYGTASTDQIGATFAVIFSSVFVNIFGADANYEKESAFGPVALSYHRTLNSNERLSFGGSAVFENAKFADKNSNSTINYSAITIAPEGKFKYLEPGKPFNMYGLLGAGLTILKTSTNKSVPHFNAQVTPLGFEYGGNVKGFLELGVGYKGIIHGGISYKF